MFKIGEEGHVLRKNGRRTSRPGPLPGKTRRARQKTRWKDFCKRDRERVALMVDDVGPRPDGQDNMGET